MLPLFYNLINVHTSVSGQYLCNMWVNESECHASFLLCCLWRHRKVDHSLNRLNPWGFKGFFPDYNSESSLFLLLSGLVNAQNITPTAMSLLQQWFTWIILCHFSFLYVNLYLFLVTNNHCNHSNNLRLKAFL